MRAGARPAEVAAGVYRVVRGTGKSNVYLVRSGTSWVLIDAGSAHQGVLNKSSAEMLSGVNTPPTAILLTHLHPDHAGSAAELAQAGSSSLSRGSCRPGNSGHACVSRLPSTRARASPGCRTGSAFPRPGTRLAMPVTSGRQTGC